MADIKNNAGLAEEIVQMISNAAADLTLTGNSITQQVAGVHVPAEEECNESFQEGSSYLTQLRQQIGHLTGYIEQISDTLQKADELSAENSRGNG